MHESRVPPGQHLTYDFPVLHYGNVPRIELAKWRLRAYGLVREPLDVTWEQFLRLPQVEVKSDFHCVTRWSKLDNVREGVLFRNIASLVSPLPQALYVIAHAYGGFTTKPAPESPDGRRRSAGLETRWSRSYTGSRMAIAPGCAQTLRMEERQMAQWSGVLGPR